jgi:hypothetical protein
VQPAPARTTPPVDLQFRLSWCALPDGNNLREQSLRLLTAPLLAARCSPHQRPDSERRRGQPIRRRVGRGTNGRPGPLLSMNQKDELQATEVRERRIDEALKETFPASDPPSFVGAGAPQATDDEAKMDTPPASASAMAGEALDRQADLSASPEEQEGRKQRLLKGPAEFRELRRDHPHQKQ